MPVASYNVTLATPISIYPAGNAGVLTVRNSDTTNTVYISDVADSHGYPLGPGSAISWDARKPLYAYVTPSLPCTIFTIDNGGGLFDAAAVAAQIAASQLAAQIGSYMPTTIKQVYGAVVYGNGYDGAVVIAAGTTTLTRDMQYTNLTVNAGGILITAGYRVFCSGTLLNNGTIHNNGGDGSAVTQQSFGIGGLTGYLAGGGNGAGNSGGPGMAPKTADLYGGSGGSAGGSTQLVDLGGVAAVSNPLIPMDTTVLAGRKIAGGGGGGGGTQNGNGNFNAGCGGGGGGVVAIFAATLTNHGTISANGGTGGTGQQSSDVQANMDGGGGGGGGFIALIYTTHIGAAATATGGAGGLKGTGGSGTAGTNGLPGISGSSAEVII